MENNYHLWIIIPGVIGFLWVFFTPILMMFNETKHHRENPRQSSRH